MRHKQYRSYPSAETHALFISARNHAIFIFQLTKNSFIDRKLQNLSYSRDFWHLANNIFNNFTSSFFPSLLQPDSSTTVSFFSKAELFAQTFATNSTLDDTRHIPPCPPTSDYFIPKSKFFIMTFFMPSLALILGWLTVIGRRNSNRPTGPYGPDGIHPVDLKNCASDLAPYLLKLLCLCLSTSSYPSCWKFVHIQPVPKKDDHSNPSNYRPLTLISCLSKVFESVLNKKIIRHLSTHNLLSDYPYGFRKGRSTGDRPAF